MSDKAKKDDPVLKEATRQARAACLAAAVREYESAGKGMPTVSVTDHDMKAQCDAMDNAALRLLYKTCTSKDMPPPPPPYHPTLVQSPYLACMRKPFPQGSTQKSVTSGRAG